MISTNIPFSRSRYQQSHCLTSPLESSKAWIVCLWMYCSLPSELNNWRKKQQMFSDWPVPLGTASVLAQNNGFYTDKKQSQHNKRLKITHVLPEKMFVIQGKKIIWRILNEQLITEQTSIFEGRGNRWHYFTQFSMTSLALLLKKNRFGFFVLFWVRGNYEVIVFQGFYYRKQLWGLYKQRTLPHLIAPHCDKGIKGQEKNHQTTY